jgi:hypothetical protein
LGLLDSLVQLSFAVHSALARVAEKHDLSLIGVRLLGILRDREPAILFRRSTHLRRQRNDQRRARDQGNRTLEWSQPWRSGSVRTTTHEPGKAPLAEPSSQVEVIV